MITKVVDGRGSLGPGRTVTRVGTELAMRVRVVRVMAGTVATEVKTKGEVGRVAVTNAEVGSPTVGRGTSGMPLTKEKDVKGRPVEVGRGGATTEGGAGRVAMEVAMMGVATMDEATLVTGAGRVAADVATAGGADATLEAGASSERPYASASNTPFGIRAAVRSWDQDPCASW